MFGWFGRKSAPERQPFVPLWLQGEGQAGAVRGYQAQLDEVYRRNPVGLRAVRLVAGLTGGLPLFAEGDARAAELVRANGLMERAAADLLLHGNAYVRLAADGHDRPAELHVMRPERVSVVSGADGWPSAYLYRAGGQVTRVPREDALGRRQVAHLKALDPSDDHYGLGCLEAAVGAASVHNRASRWNKALLDNSARPSGALVYEPGDGSSLSGEQFDRLQQELGEQFSGSANAGRPLLLDGGLKWQALGLSPAEMGYRSPAQWRVGNRGCPRAAAARQWPDCGPRTPARDTRSVGRNDRRYAVPGGRCRHPRGASRTRPNRLAREPGDRLRSLGRFVRLFGNRMAICNLAPQPALS